MKCEVCSVECEVRSVKFAVWSVCSVRCGVESAKCEV